MNVVATNIKHLRLSNKLSQEALAKIIEVPRSRIGSYEENRSAPSIGMLIKLADYFEIPVDVLIRTDLCKTGDHSLLKIANNRILFPVAIDSDNDNLIELVPVKASAGYLSGYDDPEYIEQLQHIKLPFLPTGKHRAFPIKGDSMLPMKDGAFVIGRFVESRTDIIDGRTYVLLTLNDGMVYKRVYDRITEKGNLLLVSDNKSYEPYEVPIDEIIELWEFTCCINTQEYREDELQISSILNLFNELGIELKALKKHL